MSRDERDRDVRDRVLKHLHGLLLPVLGISACTKETPPVVCDPMPAPSESLTGGTPPRESQSGYVPVPASALPSAPPVVCDPMPAPPSSLVKPPPSASAASKRPPRPRPPVVCDPMPAPPPAPKK
jgi:hypothetical protein